jgi:O-antigen/teichoic acid export membrane protein
MTTDFKASSLARRATSVLSANGFNNAASLVISIVAARVLGLVEFGKLGLAISIASTFSVVINLGLSITLVRFYPSLPDDSDRANFVGSILFWQVGLLIILGLGYQCVDFLVFRPLFPTFRSTHALAFLVVTSGCLLSIWSTVRALEQAKMDFRALNRYTFAYGLLRLTAAGILIGTHTASPSGFLLALYVGPLALLLALGLLSSVRIADLRRMRFDPRSHLRSIRLAMSYSLWVTVSAISYTVLSRLPQFALARKSSEVDLGLYSAALTFMAAFSLLNDAVRTVLLPEVVALNCRETRHAFYREMLRISPAFFLVLGSALSALAVIQYTLLGHAYRSSVPISLVLGVGTIIAIYIGLFNTMIHSYGCPHLDAVTNVCRVGLLSITLAAVPQLTALGAATAFAFILVLGESALALLLIARGKEDG